MKQHHSIGGIIFLCLLSFGAGIVVTARMTDNSRLASEHQKEKLDQAYALEEKLQIREWVLSRRLRAVVQRPAPSASSQSNVAVAALPQNARVSLTYLHLTKNPRHSVGVLAMLPTGRIAPPAKLEPAVRKGVKPIQRMASEDLKHAKTLKPNLVGSEDDGDQADMDPDAGDVCAAKIQTAIEMKVLMQVDMQIKAEMDRVSNLKH